MPCPPIEAKVLFVPKERLRAIVANSEVEVLLGFTSDELLKGSIEFADRLHSSDVALFAAHLAGRCEQREDSFLLRLRHANGDIRCVRATMRSLTKSTKGGSVVELSFVDVRSLADAADAELRSNFKTVIEQTDDVLYVKNRNHVILAASSNSFLYTPLARCAEEIIGKTEYDLLGEDAADREYELDERVLREGRGINRIQRICTRQHEWRWIDNRKYPIRDAAGKAQGIFGLVPDITAYGTAQWRLRTSKQQLRDAQHVAGLGSYVLDFRTMEWTVSPEVCLILGSEIKSHAEFDAIWKNVHPNDREWLAKRFESCFRGEGARFDLEYRIVRLIDGETRWVHTRGRLVFSHNHVPQMLRGTIQDITERKQAEKDLTESKSMLQVFIEHAPVAIAMFDQEMRYVAASRKWIEDYRLEGLDPIGQSHYALFPTLSRSWKEDHERALQGELIEAGEGLLELPRCERMWLRRRLCPWHRSDGTLGGIIIFSEDVTERRNAEIALHQSTELLELFVQHAPAGLAMFDREMRYLSASNRWYESYGLGGQEIIGRSHYEVFPELPARWKEAHAKALAGEALRCEEDRFVRTNGKVQWLRWELMPWRTGDGAIGGIVIFTEDITAKKETQEQLERAATVFKGATEGIMITDRQGVILEINDAFLNTTGFGRDEVIGKTPSLLKSGLQDAAFYEAMWGRLKREGRWSGEIWNRRKSGDIYAEMLTIHALRDADGDISQYVAHFTDITAIKEKQQQLEHIANFDALTGLPNRTLFAERLRQAMAHTRRNRQHLAVCYFDLDGFKAINDEYGQEVGDKLLTSVAVRMNRRMREGDTLARIAGDEFAVVLLDLTTTEAIGPAMSRFLSAASEEAQIGEIALRITASAGATLYPQQEEVDGDVLLRQASRAMYEAKLAGRNQFKQFDTSEDLLARSRNREIKHIRKALEDEEFVLHYQPKVNMRSGAIVGAEALIRWRHPVRGLLPPGLFLTAIEDHPLMIDLGRWVIRTVLRQIELWQTAGLDIPVSLNVSAIELQQPDFASRLRAALAEHPKVAPAKLQLEVLETSALRDVVQASHALQACRDLGVTIALDDFGIGYSSLNYLKRLPTDVLKVDQSFIRGILDEPENLTILEGVMGLAAAFRLDVIAEGVESEDHGAMLLHLGCDIAQGYGIAHPMAAEVLAKWITHWETVRTWKDVPPAQATPRGAMYAYVEHRAWFAAFDGYIQGRRTSPPSLRRDECRLGTWLRQERQSDAMPTAAMQVLERTHGQVHESAEEIYRLLAEERRSDALVMVNHLRETHNRCLNRLQAFLRMGTGRQRSSTNPRRRVSRTGHILAN